jgi:Transposase DDE domain
LPCYTGTRKAQPPVRRSSNQTSVSQTDPDAKLRAKPGQRPHLVHRGQVAVDPKARCIIACLGEQADGHEGDAAPTLHERARFHCPELASLVADQGFAAERVWSQLESRSLEVFIPPQKTMLAKGGEPKTQAERQALHARERCKSEAGVRAHKRLMADAEGVISELKTQGTLHRARCQGHGALSRAGARRLRGGEHEASRRSWRPARRRAGGTARRRRPPRSPKCSGAA